MLRFLLVLLTLALAALGATFVMLENPDRFRSQLTSMISANSDYTITIDGELQWRYWPPIAIQAREITITDQTGLKAQFSEADIDLDLLPLLTQGHIVDINRLLLTNGEVIINRHQSAATSGDSNSTREPVPPPTIHELVIRQVSIAVPDAGLEVTISDFNTSRLAADAPFDFSWQGTAKFGEAVQLTADATGRLLYLSDTGRIRFDDLMIQQVLSLNGEQFPALRISARGEWRPEQEAVTVTDSQVSSAAMIASFTGVINLAGESPRLDGIIKAESASVHQLAAIFDLTSPVSTLQLDSDIQLTADRVRFQTLAGQFDQTSFKGQLSMTLGDLSAVNADLRLDRLDLNNYLAASAEAGESRSAEPESPLLVPQALLKSTSLDVILRLDELVTQNYSFSAAKLELHADRQESELSINGQGLNGKLLLTARTNLQNNSTTRIGINLDDVDVAQLAQTADITGRMSGHSNLQFTGTRLADLESSIAGQSIFSIRDGSLDVTPIKGMAQTIDLLRGKQSRISRWPDQVPFNQMTGEHQFLAGTPDGQVLTVRVENLNIMAMGGFDLARETLDYDVTTIFEAREDGPFSVSEQVAGIRWPLQCRGTFTDSPADLCFSEEGAITRLVQDIVKQDLKRRGRNKIKDAIEDKLPDELKGLTDGLLKGIFD